MKEYKTLPKGLVFQTQQEMQEIEKSNDGSQIIQREFCLDVVYVLFPLKNFILNQPTNLQPIKK